MFSFDTYNYTSNRFTKSPEHLPRHGARRQRQPDLPNRPGKAPRTSLTASAPKGNRTIYLEAALNYKQHLRADTTVSGMLLFNQSDEINTKATNVEEAAALPLPRSGRTLHLRDSTTATSPSSTSDTTARRTSPQEPLRFLPLGGSGLGDLQRVILRATHRTSSNT